MEIMMTNVFIDPTILAFPPEVSDIKKDVDNLRKFYEDISDFFDCVKNQNKMPRIAFFKEEQLDRKLSGQGYDYHPDSPYDDGNQKRRIKRMRHYDIHEPHDIKKRIQNFYRLFYGYGPNKHGMKIIEFEMENHGESNKGKESENKAGSHYLSLPFFQNEHKKLFNYASEIGKKYSLPDWKICSRDNNYPGMEKKFISVEQLKKEYESYTRRFDTLKSAFDEAKNKFKVELNFGEEILSPDPSHPASIFHDDTYDQDFVPDRLFYYLETLGALVKYINTEKGMCLNDRKLNELVKNFGCDSAPDSRRFKEHRCSYRIWKINGELEQFSLHLRPLTKAEVDIKNELTMRIYYKWKKAKGQITIGMICKHPPECEKCLKSLKCYPPTCQELSRVKSDVTDDIPDSTRQKISRNGIIDTP
jgi:hypothetical protein